MILLDTSFIIDLLREKNNAVLKAKELENKDSLATTSINVYELLLGVYSMKNINREEKLHETVLEYESLVGTIKRILGDGSEHPIEKTYLAPSASPQGVPGEQTRKSLESRRFYLDVLLRLYVEDLTLWLKRKKYDARVISEIHELFNTGRYHEMESLLRRVIG